MLQWLQYFLPRGVISVWEYAMSEEIGRRIKAAREKLHWSQAKLAHKIEVNSLTVLRWEHGRSIPHYENQQKLIKLIGMRQEDFLIEEKQPVPPPPIQLMEPEQARLISHPAIQHSEAEPEQELLATHQITQPEEAKREQSPSVPKLILPPESEFKLYRGRRIIRHVRDGVITRHPYVTVNGSPLKPFGTEGRNPVEQFVFEWGYSGIGPGTLAEAILADFFAEDYPEKGCASQRNYDALLYGSLFKEAFITKLPLHIKDDEDDDWEISSDQIRRWFYTLEEKGITKEALLKSAYGEKYYMRD